MFQQFSKRLIFTLLAGTAASMAYAGTVSADNARQLAADFFAASGQENLASESALELVYTCGDAAKPLYYVFNARQGQGFVIVSADDCTTPVLGYSLENNYNVASVPPAMKWMMGGLENEIKAASKLQKPTTQEVRRSVMRRAARSNEKILLNTPEWRQEAPFNNMIPGRPLVGCVGTAMATIMKYHNYPQRGTGSYNGVNFDVAYDWDNMRMDNYRYGYSETEANAVATLVYHAAASIGTQFGYSGSSAYEVKVPAALINYFGYAPGVSFKKRSEAATQAEFDRLVENDIKAGRPVLYCGQDVTAGHAFVVDGYDPLTSMIHVNWGWGGADGNNNGGWYASTALNPTVSQQHSFNNLTTIIYNIKPGNGNNSSWSPIHITADGRQVGMGSDLKGDLAVGTSFTVRVGNLKNVSYNDFSGKIAVALFDAQGTFKSLLSAIDGFSLSGMAIYPYGYADFKCQLPAGVAVADGDMIRMATSADNGTTWLPVAGELVTTNEIPAKGAAPQYFAITRPSSITGATFTGENSVIRGWNYHFTVVPEFPERDMVTVKANGYVVSPGANHTYTIGNVVSDQEITVYVQNAADVKEKRSLWVEAGSLESLLPGGDATALKELTLFGMMDSRDFAFIKGNMKSLTRLDISSVRILANGSDPANAVPRDAFRNLWKLKEVVLPNSVNRLCNGAFRSCGISKMVIPAGVRTIDYNVFNASSGLLDIWVSNSNPVYINWCVLHATPTSRMTLHCPSEAAVNNYKAKEYWKDIANIIVDPIVAPADCSFAVMEDDDVKYVCDIEPGSYEKGKKIVFSAEHIADNDNRMDVYANSTLLKPDAQGNYSTVLNGNTIIHFDLVEPTPVSTYESPWTITDDGGTVGMFTDAVNVLPGVPFSIRINSFSVTDNAFWAVVLTTDDGRIKEFISPIGNWSAGPGKGLKMNVNCCVNDATVREGNLIRLATSFNKRTWALVNGKNDNVIASLPALNNQTPVYNFTFSEGLESKANMSGVVSTAVHGRDLTFKITPKQASHMIDAVVNGDTIIKAGKAFTYSFIAKQDIDFDINIYPPVTYTEATIVLKDGEHLYLSGDEGIDNWGVLNHQMAEKYKNIKKLKIVGKLDYYDFNFFRENYWIAANIRYLDLSEATFVRDRDKDAKNGLDNVFPRNAFKNDALGGCYIEEIVLPSSLTQFDDLCFNGCSRLREIRLPSNLRNWTTGPTPYVGAVKNLTRGGLNDDVFKGCTSLETIYLPCVPGVGGKVGHWYYSKYHALKTGLPDNTKVTVVVPAEHLTAYKTPHVDDGDFENQWSNGWEAGGFNLVGEYPVYALDFDPSRCFIAEAGVDVSKIASFLKDNVALEQMDCKLYVATGSNESANRPEGVDAYDASRKYKVYDNGKLLDADKIGADGSISITYYNPNKHADKSGNHAVEVAYLYDVTFNCASANLLVAVDNIRNNEESAGDEATEFETFNYYNALAPVLENVKENSSVRFKVSLTENNPKIAISVKNGENVVSPDEEGYYTVDVTDSNVAVSISAVPVNGATLTSADIDAITPADAVDVTSIALAGDIEADKVKDVIDQLPSIQELDLSELTTALPAEAMAGKETLVTVSLPAADHIEDGTFSGCTNLTGVEVPSCVSSIGANAFSGCSSLQTINFTDVKSIGASAFNGCTGLTSVIFTAPGSETTVARVRSVSRSARAEGYSADAFAGINPNCIVYLDENVAVPDAPANYVRVRKDDTVEGGRVYEALGSISIDPMYDFRALNTFNVTEGNTISMEMPLDVSYGASNWSSFVIPFVPAKVTNVAGDEISAYTGSDDEVGANGSYMVASLSDETAEGLSLMAGIQANVPYVAGLCAETEPGVVRFESGACEVANTPDNISVNGAHYTLSATFAKSELPTATTYMLTDDGSAFATSDDYAETVTAAPFSVYAVAPSGDRFDINIEEAPGVPTGIDGVYAESGLRIAAENGVLVIYSDTEGLSIDLYSVNGMRLREIRLSAGRNEVSGLLQGVYVISGQKVVL